MDAWIVEFTGKALQRKDGLPPAISSALDLLRGELEIDGPERTDWPHHGRIVNRQDVHHCHLNESKPCSEAVWKVTGRDIQLIEARYVGTHENADSRRID